MRKIEIIENIEKYIISETEKMTKVTGRSLEFKFILFGDSNGENIFGGLNGDREVYFCKKIQRKNGGDEFYYRDIKPMNLSKKQLEAMLKRVNG